MYQIVQIKDCSVHLLVIPVVLYLLIISVMRIYLILTLVCTLLSVSLRAQTDRKQNAGSAADHLYPSSGALIEGRIGELMDSCIKNGVMSADYGLYSIPFRDKTDRGGLFQGEFWGKWFTSAALATSYQSTPEQFRILEESVKELLAAQDKDGRISSYPREETFLNWDIWGRKYVLLGLISYYDLTGDPAALKAASRMVDELIEIAGPGKQKLTETGLQVLGSMSSTSILEPIALVYQRTGKKNYLDFAEYLVSLWSEPNTYTEAGMNLVSDALSGKPPVNISSPKAYEVMSCFEGLCELYRATGKTRYLDAVVRYGELLLEREIMIVGSGSSAELWCDGAFRQTELLEQPMETCVTATWMKFCYQLLRLTGDSKWADQLEISLYNALAGAMNQSGDWWAYFSPLSGERMPSPMQVPQCNSSCCVVNGPRGLLTTPGWSVMTGEEGPVVNLYSSGTWKTRTPDGSSLILRQTSSYPKGDEVVIEIEQQQGSEYTFGLRIPEWSKVTELTVNGEPHPCESGSYAKIRRKWENGDKIGLRLDMRGRIVQSPGSVNDLAVMRGPIVLTLDKRMVVEADYNLWLYAADTKWNHVDELGGLDYVLPEPISSGEKDRYIELKPVPPEPEGVWMAFEVPFLYRYTHFFNHNLKSLIMCDYSSAGNQFSTDNLFRVWIPQPLYMQQIFPVNTWKILYREGDKRPEFPTLRKSKESENTWDTTIKN
jgi:DUF1680 family protein